MNLDRIFEDWDEEEYDKLYDLEIIDIIRKDEYFSGTMRDSVTIKLGWNNINDVNDIFIEIVNGPYDVLNKKNYPERLYNDNFKKYQIVKIYKHIDKFKKLYKKWI